MSLKRFIEKRKPVICSSDDKVCKVANQMSQHNVGSVIVAENEKPVGLITDRDIAIRYATNPNINMTAKEVMSKPVHTIGSNKSIFDVTLAMKENECRRIVVSDDNQGILGVISSGDLMELFINELSMLGWVTTPHEEKLIPKKAS